jgi:hypothetical protein
VLDEISAWQNRPLEPVYPVVFFDALRVKIRDEGLVRNKAVHIALGVRADGGKEILGLWLEQNEGAKFWLRVMNELRGRGVEDLLLAMVDGLKGFPEAIMAVFPEAQVQTCIVHLLRQSLVFVPYKDRKAVAAALKAIYQAVDAATAEAALTAFEAGAWGQKYPAIGQSWRRAWGEVVPFYAFSVNIRRFLYTTNVIEALNSKLHRAVRARGHFPTDDRQAQPSTGKCSTSRRRHARIVSDAAVSWQGKIALLGSDLRLSTRRGRTPVQPFQQHRQLRCRQPHGAFVRDRRPDEPALLEPLSQQHQALAVPPQGFHQVTAPAPEAARPSNPCAYPLCQAPSGHERPHAAPASGFQCRGQPPQHLGPDRLIHPQHAAVRQHHLDQRRCLAQPHDRPCDGNAGRGTCDVAYLPVVTSSTQMAARWAMTGLLNKSSLDGRKAA